MFFDILRAFFSLFIIIDIIGNTPLIVKLLENVKKNERIKSINLVIVVASVVLFLFLLFGSNILNFFGISLKSFTFAGSIILFLVGLEMVLGIKLGQDITEYKFSAVPLATPFLIGPGVLVTVVLLTNEYGKIVTSISALFNVIIIYFVMKASFKISRFLGLQGSEVLTRIMGLILTSISIEIFLKGFGM